LLLALAGAAGAQELPPGAAACMAALGAAAAAAGSEDEAPTAGEFCLQFVAALEASPWGGNLLDGEASSLTRAGLETLTATTAAYGDELDRPLSRDSLQDLVAALEPFVTEPPPSLWQRFVDWIDGLISPGEVDESWFSKWLSSLSIPEAWIRSIVLAFLGLVVLTAVGILVNELRLAGAFAGRGTQHPLKRLERSSNLHGSRQAPSFEDIANAPALSRKVELLFALALHRLNRRQAARLRPSATHRQIASAAIDLDPRGRERLATLAMAAERVTYAAWEPDDPSWQTVLTSGNELFDQLDGAAVVQAGAGPRSDARTDARTGPTSNARTDAPTDAGTDAGTDARTDTDADAGADTDVDAGADGSRAP
jgi:hypothetical protein